jgi:hypothetical protein
VPLLEEKEDVVEREAASHHCPDAVVIAVHEIRRRWPELEDDVEGLCSAPPRPREGGRRSGRAEEATAGGWLACSLLLCSPRVTPWCSIRGGCGCRCPSFSARAATLLPLNLRRRHH